MERIRDLPLSLFASLMGLALVLWWLAELLSPPPDTQEAKLAHTVDYFAGHFIRTEMKADGNPKSRLRAVAMRHYADDDSSDLDTPVMLFYNEDAPPWIVRSDTGTISGDGKTILLHGKAVLNRESYAKGGALEVISKDVTVHMDEKYLESIAFTEIFNSPHYTSGTGMHTDFSGAMKVTLLSDVRGRYEF